MRTLSLCLIVLVGLIAALAPAAAGPAAAPPSVAIENVKLAGPHLLQIDIAAQGFDGQASGASQGTGAPAVTLSVWLDGVPTLAAMPLIHMPPRFAMVFDLAAGVVSVGGISVGAFHPIPPFAENMRFPIEVTIQHGPRTARAQREAAILLPTVVVPGYLDEIMGPDSDMLAAFRRHGYTDTGPSPSVFGFQYSSQVSLEAGAQSLASYVRQTVLPATYAAKINVVGFSAGGLMARWNIENNTDGWGSLVNRLVLVGVPNEGVVLAYVGEHAPSFFPFAGVGKSPIAHSVLPTFPFWHDDPGQAWTVPPDSGNPFLARLNAQPIPPAVRVYLFYGSHDPRNTAGPKTAAGITGRLPGAVLSYGPGDGIVLAASAQGLPINGGPGVAGLADRAVLRVDLGSVYHLSLLGAGADRIAGALLDRFSSTVDEGAARQ